MVVLGSRMAHACGGGGDACGGGGEACGGAEIGVWLVAAPWKMGHPVAGGTGCRGLLVEGVWWAE